MTPPVPSVTSRFLASLLAESVADKPNDISTIAGWNLRALLLRSLGGEPRWPGAVRFPERREMADYARRLGLLGEMELTPIGREVAERLRPKPWQVKDIDGEGDIRAIGPGGEVLADSMALTEIVARLLTEHYEREAKTYKTEAG